MYNSSNLSFPHFVVLASFVTFKTLGSAIQDIPVLLIDIKSIVQKRVQIKSWSSYRKCRLFLRLKWKGKRIGKLSVKLHHHLRLRCVINYFVGDVFALQYFSAHQVMINEERTSWIVYNGTRQQDYRCKIRQMILLFVTEDYLKLSGKLSTWKCIIAFTLLYM